MNTLSPKHTVWHDIYALFLGGSLIVLALVMLKSAGVFTSGLSGWAFLLSEITPYAFGEILFVISIPFYIFAYRLLGFWFTLRTVVLITLISVSVDMIGAVLQITVYNPLITSIVAGGVGGMGLLGVMRHGMSLGGFGVLGAFLQHKNILRAGVVMMGADVVLVVLSAFVFSWENILYSLASMIAVNMVVIVNHKPDWYISVSHGMG